MEQHNEYPQRQHPSRNPQHSLLLLYKPKLYPLSVSLPDPLPRNIHDNVPFARPNGICSSASGPHAVQPFPRPCIYNEITFEEVVTRIVTSGVVWLAAFCIIATWNAFLEFFFVGTGLSEPKSWRPLFGSFAETYTVRGFWGYVSLPLPLPYPHSPSRKLTTRTANSGTNSSVNPTPTPPPISSTVSSIFQKVYYPAI
jgi:hypothetical protein